MTEQQTTKIIWGIDVPDLEEKFKATVEKYPYLQEERYSHKREQLYLMLQYGMSERFIANFFQKDPNISSRDLDFVRMAAMLFGETFVNKKFYKKEYALDQAKEVLAEQVVELRCSGLPKLEDMLQEQKQMIARFELQCDFLEKERAQAKLHYEELLEKEIQLGEERADKERLRAESKSSELEQKLRTTEKEKGALMEELTDARRQHEEESNVWDAEKKRLLEKCSELKRQLETENVGQDAEKESFFGQFRNRKEQQRIRREKEEWNQFILNVISNPDFSKDQLDFILQAIQSELTLPELRQLCNPKLRLQSMELLKQFYLKQRSAGV